jgi:hypothetical protein
VDMKDKKTFLNVEKSLIADIFNIFILGMSVFLYGLITFCF